MVLKELLQLTVKRQASDLHIAPGESPMIRFNGDLVRIPNMENLPADQTKNLIYSSMSSEQQKKFTQELELDYVIQIANVARFRVNAFHQNNGMAAVFRVIPNQIPMLEQLKLPTVFKDILNVSNGIILLTGPTGSGKSTTLAAMVDYINRHEERHIITIEDPIEFIHHSKKSLINQRQVYRDTHTFPTALRSALREDPDVILVGEMRDLETIRLALTAAETGHLVMATMHTSSAPRTISRIVDVFPGEEKNIIRNLLAESLLAVICQTLVKNQIGSRTAAFEIMLCTSAIRNLIREDKTSQMHSTIQTSGGVGMRTLDQYLQDLVNQQVISQEAAIQASTKLLSRA